LGLWVAAEGLIYDMFDKTKHVIQSITEEIEEQLMPVYYISCDYGTQNATVFLLWQKLDKDNWICIKEYYYSGRDKGKQKTDSEFADDFEMFALGYDIKYVILDPSAASFRVELRNRGFKIMKANNDVENGIRFVATLLNEGKLMFMHSCDNTLKEFSSYVWDEKAAEHGEDKPIKQNDHAMDAVRYFCYTVIHSNAKYNKVEGGI
jgi:PBSX family phage terminase large subunit